MLGQLHRLVEQRGTSMTAGLFGGLGGDGRPGGRGAMRSALVRSVITSRNRRAPSSAAFSTMVSTRVLLDHGDDQVEVGAVCLGPDLFLSLQDDALLEHLDDGAAPFAVLTVEDLEVVTRLQPHDLCQIARLVQRGRDGRAGGQGLGDVEADHRS
jgi:hypothetical protein